MKALIALAVLLFSVACYADQEASNRPVVRSSEYGIVYAKSIPDEDYGQKGKTYLYYVGSEKDELICEYNWFANEIYIGGSGETFVVRFGPWHRGYEPQDTHLAIGIYNGSRVVREYSTTDLIKMGSGISNSVSHYQVFGKRLGFRWISGDIFVFEVEGTCGKVFSFDLQTGSLIER